MKIECSVEELIKIVSARETNTINIKGPLVSSKVICKRCKIENKITSNFCVNCGEKIKDICDCWIKKQPYNCGEDKCPSYRLYKKTIIQEK